MIKICEECKDEYRPTRGTRQRFCSLSCSSRYNGRRLNNHSEAVGKSTKTDRRVSSIYDISSRTRSKVIRRIGLCCSRCGWDKAICDIHHIKPRKDGGTNDHGNLIYVCPNCHRLLDNGTVKSNELRTLDQVLPSNWRDYYYG